MAPTRSGAVAARQTRGPTPPSSRWSSSRWSTAVAALVGLALASGTTATSDSCPKRAPQAHYSSKTAYQLVHGGSVTPYDTVDGCYAVYVWHLLRHGTRFPSPKEVAKLLAEVPAVQSRVRANAEAGRVPAACRGAVDRMLGWSLAVTPAHGNELTPQGERDLFGIGRRQRARYPAFFGKHPHANQFVFRSTQSQRTEESAKWYAKGLFNESVDLPKPMEKDPLLKFYAMCPAWDTAVDNNASARAEVSSFQGGPEVGAALRRVSTRLGFENTLTYEEVDLLWEACRYDQAWDPNNEATWCAAFSDEDLLVFEYRADLKYYYVGGYGNSMDLQLGCPLVKDIVDKLSTAESGKADRSGNFYFTHSTALHMTLARLGVGRDATPLTAHNFDAMKNDRQWDISRLGPFAANLAVVLYRCPYGEQFKISMFLNEVPLPLPDAGCNDANALCSWTAFKTRFGKIADSCNLKFCNGGSSAVDDLATKLFLSAFTALFAGRILR